MAKTDECKGCQRDAWLSDEEIELIYKNAIESMDTELADDEVYKARLDKCFECNALLYGATCVHCGCIVQVKARVLNASCPYPFQPKW